MSSPEVKGVKKLSDDAVKIGDFNKQKLNIKNLDYVLSIPIEISVEVGRTRSLVEDVLKLGQGSVIELDKLTAENLDVMANGRLIGKGEVVVINENFGVKFTEIIDKADRIGSLR